MEVHRGERTARKTTVTFQSYAEDVIADREGINDRTRDLYSINLRLYLKHLHSYRLGDITASVLRATYAGLRKKGLSDTIRGHAHTLARLILETARIDGLIARNPADEPTIRPKSTRGDEAGVVRAYDAQQVARILRAAPQVTHGELIAFLLLTGVRRGEALALRWSSVYREQRHLIIRTTRSISNHRIYEGSPKTKQSRRNVPLSGEVVALLNHLKATNYERREMLYPDLAESLYVFVGLTGKAMRPDNVRRIMHQVLDVADQEIVQVEKQRVAETGESPQAVLLMPRLRVHDLRHTFVSLMAARGVRLEIIAKWIGDNPETVMRVYLHVFQQHTAMPDLALGDMDAFAQGEWDDD